MNKKVAIIGTVGLPAKYGGFETLVNHLTQNLSNQFDITVYCSGKAYINQVKTYNGAKLKYINLNANGAQSILYDIVSIFKSLKKSDVLLILGVSGCIALPFINLIWGKKIIVNIDGLEWKRAKWGRIARSFLKFSEKIAVKNADYIIADNKVIKDYVKSEYGVNSHLIAYGADHVTEEPLDEKFIEQYPFAKKKYSFKVCRIEPENNIHIILHAFSRLTDKIIVVVGNWENSEYGKKLNKEFEQFKNIFMLNPIYDQKTLNQLRSNCSIYIHGHSAGGTNPSLVEAMQLGMPILAYGVQYNRETTRNEAAYFDNTDELVSLLNDIKKNELSLISKNMKFIAKEIYTWKYISQKYSYLFSSNKK
jgi:glycosyltransferase involved in cell wall biosynthesis